jgi:hypothetical protein
MTKAVTPLAEQIGTAVNQLKENSQSGVQDMLQRFSETIHGGAGTELVALRESLEEVRKSMETVRSDMGRSGQDFATQLGEAAANLRKMIEETGRGLGEQSAVNTRELEKMRAALTDVFERASQKVDENLATAADGASLKLTAAMDRVLQKLEGQLAGWSKVSAVSATRRPDISLRCTDSLRKRRATGSRPCLRHPQAQRRCSRKGLPVLSRRSALRSTSLFKPCRLQRRRSTIKSKRWMS